MVCYRRRLILMAELQAIKVAVVGAGRMAREHLRAFGAAPGVCLAGIHSRSRGKAESLARAHGVEPVCDTVEELHERSRADLVVVTVNVGALVEVGLACARFPWKVLMEKPPGLSVAETESLLATTTAQGRDFRVALNRQWLSATQGVLQQLRAVEGTRFIKVQDQQPFAALDPQRHPPEVRRRWMYANSIHTIDYFRILGRGEIRRVVPVIPWDPAAPGMVVAKIEYENGDQGLYEGIWHAPGPWAATVTVPGRRWEMRPLEQAVTQELGGKAAPIPVHPWDTQFKPGFRLQAEQAVNLVCSGRSGLPTLEEALRTMQLIERLYPRPAC